MGFNGADDARSIGGCQVLLGNDITPASNLVAQVNAWQALRCPSCHAEIARCPSCAQPIKATVEKGVDTLIATDMIRLAWEQAYDVAVLATSDADLIPAVEFLHLKARKVIQAGFPPAGSDLATACWASFDVFPHRAELSRV